ncbi:conserved hypothetical protein [Ricinus communis]|uniref:Phytosulfokine n=1 Tax=Ricinus communis TaxID=3988 RepID=B9R6X1_RICCO|nr:conserved hypothetical protein [Ricinus communis]
MSKLSTFFTLALILSFVVTNAVRPNPDYVGAEITADKGEANDENCDGLGEKECLTKTTQAAQTDYIYTQSLNKNP